MSRSGNTADSDQETGDPSSDSSTVTPEEQDVIELLKRARDVSPHCVDDLVPAWARGSTGKAKDPETHTFDDVSGDVTRIGRFQIIEKLGEGGFGMVFLAHDPKLEREVALKIPRSDTLLSEEARHRFINEGKALARLNHRHVATVPRSR